MLLPHGCMFGPTDDMLPIGQWTSMEDDKGASRSKAVCLASTFAGPGAACLESVSGYFAYSGFDQGVGPPSQIPRPSFLPKH
jgi:hypothetical protein